MGLVRVWNDNIYPFTQEFKGTKIQIPAGESITMEHEEAVEFKGEFYPIKKNKDGGKDPRSFKKIRIETTTTQTTQPQKFVHPLTGKVFATKKELDLSLKETADLVIKDDVAEEEMKLTATSYAAPTETAKPRGRPKKNAGITA